MREIILFTGIYDLFSLKLASKVSGKYPFAVYYFGTEENTKYLYKIIETVRSVEEREYLSTCLNRFICIKDEKYFAQIDKQDFQIYVWYMDNVYPETETYNLQALLYNEREAKRIERLCKEFKVIRINYLSSIYAYIEDGMNNIFLKAKELNEEYVLNICKDNDIQGRIYRTPILYKQTQQVSGNDYIGLLAKRIKEFVNWVKGRVPNYFEKYKIQLLLGDDSVIHTLDSNKIINKIIDLETEEYEKQEKRELTEVYHLCARTSYSTMEVCRRILKEFYNIDADLTENVTMLTDIDHILHKICTYHLPYLQEKRCNTKKVELDTLRLEELIERQLISEDRTDGSNGVTTKEVCLQTGNKLTYQVAGSGPAILIVNAYGVSTQAWDPLVKMLSQNYYVIYWRSRGLYHHEKNGDPDSYCGIEDQIEDVEQIVKQEQLRNFHIMSWCSGAKTAILYGLKHPDKVLSQIFIAGEFAPFIGSEPYHSKFRENIQLIAELIQNNERMLDFYMKIIDKGMFNHPVKEFSDIDKGYIYEIMPEEHRDILLSPFATKETMVNFLMMCMEYYKHDVTEKLKTIDVPTLFIAAECDQVAPYMQSKWAHTEVKDSAYVCLPAGTHLIILERTSDVYEIIMQHMKYNNFKS
ncbi:alpha/beta fold hydrolase [Anaerosporobacter faecicola]|uniref:alpha/beta fold hydrolase n=1 Tax=Anaerosporobacter faecicola TaxID=2718714 RepID=UPI0014388384|nr:alpha/beta hydrolase [Anaerosporobacter faecicola]